jgi:hypothetical protein
MYSKVMGCGKMSKQSSKELFEWYGQVAEEKLKEKFSHIATFKDCKDETEFKNWILLKYIQYYGLRCTCDDCMDWEFHIASSHYHHCQLYTFCHAINRSLEWAEFKEVEKKEVAGCNADCHDGIPPNNKLLGILPTIL